MKLRFLLLVLLVSLPAWAAGQLDTLRAAAKSAREQASAVRDEQMSKRQALNTLSARIEALKAQEKGALLTGGELDAALKQSQELSGALTGLAQTMSVRESQVETAQLALLEALNTQLTSLRADFDRQTNRVARQKVLAQFKALRAEREQVRASLPAAKVPALESMKASDDPSELLEQADAVRDNEDKVRRELKAIESRLAEAKAERDLDGRVRQFLGEESLFDDQDRRMRVRRVETIETTPPTTGLNSSTNAKGGTSTDKTTFGASPTPPVTPQTAGAADINSPANPSPPPGGGAGGDRNNGAGGTDSFNTNPATGLTTRTTTGSDAHPSLGGQKIAGGDDDDLEELEVQRLKLNSLANELKARAAELEKKAAQLR